MYMEMKIFPYLRINLVIVEKTIYIIKVILEFTNSDTKLLVKNKIIQFSILNFIKFYFHAYNQLSKRTT